MNTENKKEEIDVITNEKEENNEDMFVGVEIDVSKELGNNKNTKILLE